MTIKKLLLIQDNRGGATVQYKEFVGHKLLKGNIIDFSKADAKQKATTFTKKLILLDVVTNTYRKQKVICEVISIENKYAVIGVK